MKYPLLGAALLAGLSANAQMNRGSVNLYSVAGSKAFTATADGSQRNDNSGINLLPTLGYHRIVRGNTGIGVELGYGRIRSTYENRIAEFGDRTTFSKTTISSDEFFISPGIYEVITTPNKRYRIIPSLNLPIGFVPESKSRMESRTVQNSTGELVSANVVRSAPQQQLRIGIQAGVSAQIRVAGNFYAGIFVGGAVSYYRNKTKGEYRSILDQQGQQPIVTRASAPDNLMQGYGFGLLPQINLNYYF